jgi:iron complex outermembrane receptor protein
MDITDRLKVMGGARWDTLNVVYNRNLQFGGFPIFAPPTEHNTYQRWSPRAGIVYEAVPGAMSFYGTWTRSFSPPSGSVYAQNPGGLLPEYGETWEGGVKANIFDNLMLTVSGFHTERQNDATQITNFNVVNNALQRSQGVEMNLIGNWTERLSTVTNYTYADVQQTGPAGFPVVNGRVRGVPFASGNVWNRYNLIQERDRTFGLGLGYVYVGDRRGDYTTPLVLPSYSRWDMGVYGRYRRLDMTAYIENIFDVRYSTGSINQYQVYPGAPTNFRLQMGVTF